MEDVRIRWGSVKENTPFDTSVHLEIRSPMCSILQHSRKDLIALEHLQETETNKRVTERLLQLLLLSLQRRQ